MTVAPSMSKDILVVDDEAILRESLSRTLQRTGYSVVTAGSAEEALALLEGGTHVRTVITDIKMPGRSGLDLVEEIQHSTPQLPVVLITAHGTIESAVSAMKKGAYDYIRKPFTADEIEIVIGKALDHHDLLSENAQLRRELEPIRRPDLVIGSSAAMQEVSRLIRAAAGSDATILLQGESGSGKEVLARALHDWGTRKDRPFLAVNCAALTAGLLESELFGHEKGAFTGAQEMRKGRFELAHGGTLLLDEISEMDLGLQSKLLRVLQEMAFERVGSSVTRKVDVRVVATTNRNLKEEASAGRFRQDLYFRLAVIPIQVPALRERKQDIPELSAHYLEKLQAKLGRPHKLLPQAHDLLIKYSWPGNVRELFNVLERAAILNPDENIGPEQLAPMLEMAPFPNVESGAPTDHEITIEEMEQQLILSTLDRLNGHKTNAAKSLGITVKTLRNKLGRWGIDR